MAIKTVIGLEIHVELSTKSKMFCSCKNEFGLAPNTSVCPVCLGHPGALPWMNKTAIEYGIMAGLAFDCDICQNFKMDRKKYFYPDLTKGYQITQEENPLCTNGKIRIQTKDGEKDIRIQRIHIEEDTGKSIHNEDGNTLMDYNRAGVPLIEIVSQPDMNSPEEAHKFLEILKDTIKYIGISDVKMSEGSLRCDVNINVVDGDFKTKITEVKNLNSFKSVLKALEYEMKRHQELANKKIIGEKETRRWDESSMQTIVMRHKEEGNDYRFSVEGDIPRTIITEEYISKIKDQLPELPREKMNRFIEQYHIEEYDADILTRNALLSNYFEEIVHFTKEPQITSNWLLADFMRQMNETETQMEDIKLDALNFAKLIRLTMDRKISNNIAKKVLREIFITNEDPDEYVKEHGLIQLDDDKMLLAIVDDVLQQNEQSIEDIKNGKDRAIGFLVGQCMKASKGKGNPQKFNQMIRDAINKI